MAEGACDYSVGQGNTNLQGDSCAGQAERFSPGDVFCFDVSRCGLINDHIESCGRGEGVFGHVKEHLWGFRSPRMIDRVPLQVAVISLICLSLNLCVYVCVFAYV